MRFLLNISTHANDVELAGPGWEHAAALLRETGFEGFELYPVGGYEFSRIPASLVGGVHLRFFVMLRQIWQNDYQGLLRLFDTDENIRMYYGGSTREAVISCYRDQLELARSFGVPYVVFHPVHYELEYVFNWQPPWTWQETVDLSAEVISEALRESDYEGWVLFENLWWPGNFRLDSTREIDRLLERVNYERCGIVLDTAHVFNKNQDIRTEEEAVSFLLEEVDALGEYRKLIRAVHLCKSLSGEHVRAGMRAPDPFRGAETFWDRFSIALDHVRNIDTHDAFDHGAIAGLFDRISPEHVVFEFSFRSMEEWRSKIDRQVRALGDVFRQGGERNS
ncbi:sugar phosphate isomerase/epimerase [Prosthecochloris sp. ZM_2]|uniref:TIM barrel protein n=1 Tax=Prosthecochloris sp. ZM_2 TaxID=2045206 RepID=UPI000DF78606|nr:TIM barrel protein [Prosthecochloris sp. ZM_2]RNA64842.1 sugar phosphate isomerase/epimerase [Prosthecochloris sp. ZM_2]